MADTTIAIERIVLREIRLRLVEPFATAGGIVDTRRLILLELTDADGASAWGECVALEDASYLPETIDTAWPAIRDQVASRVMARAFEHPREVAPWLAAEISGNGMARAAVEMACWSLAAEKSGVSLSRFLGGTRDAVPTGVAIGLQDGLERLGERVAAASEEGYARIKIKIQPGQDVACVEAACNALDSAGKLMVDANGAYTLEDSSVFDALDSFGLMMIEQPLAREAMEPLAQLQARLKTPVCLDESLLSLSDVEAMHRLGSGRVVNLKPGRVGGFGAAIAIHDFCVAHGIPLWCGGMLESGVGRAHNVALASLPGFTMPGDLSPSSRYWSRDLVSPEWVMDARGMVRVPVERPGCGVAVDSERIEALSVRKVVLEKRDTPG